MKLKYDFVTNKVADKTVAVAVGNDASEFNGFIKLNDTGAFIFEHLRKEISRDGLVELLEKEYDAPREVLEKELDEFIVEMKNSGVLI